MSSNRVLVRNDRVAFGQGSILQERVSLIPDLQRASTLFIGPASMALRNAAGVVTAVNPLSSILSVDTGNKRVSINGNLYVNGGVLYGDGSGLYNLPGGVYTGGSSGTNIYYATNLYLNYSLNAAPYKAMQVTTTTNARTILMNSLSPASVTAISQFQTDFTSPSSIPGGIWSFNLYADANNGNNFLYVSLYTRVGSTETLLATTSDSPTPIFTSFSPSLYSVTMNVPTTLLSSGMSIVMKVYASNSDPDWASMVRTHYEGSAYSYVRTSLAYSSITDQIVSTVSGLGSTGYISSLSLQSTVRSLSSNLVSTTTGIYQTLGSSIQTSSIQTTALTFQDSMLGNVNGTLYQKSSVLYFNNTPIGGAFTLFSQMYG